MKQTNSYKDYKNSLKKKQIICLILCLLKKLDAKLKPPIIISQAKVISMINSTKYLRIKKIQSYTIPLENRTLPTLFYEPSIILIPKEIQSTIRKENHKPVFLMNVSSEIFSKILTNQMQQHINGILQLCMYTKNH